MYIIRKTKNNSTIIYMEYDDKSYEVNVHSRLISNLCVYNKKYLPKVNDKIPFDYFFNELTKDVFSYLYSDDDDDSNASRLIGEVDRIKNLLDSEYKEFMKRQEYYQYVDKLCFIRDEIRNKIAINKYKQNINSLISGRSR